MRARLIVITLLTLTATMAGAQAPKTPAAPAAPSPGDKCLADLPQWQTYAANLKASRDALEQDIATLRARAEVLQKHVAELEKAAAPK